MLNRHFVTIGLFAIALLVFNHTANSSSISEQFRGWEERLLQAQTVTEHTKALKIVQSVTQEVLDTAKTDSHSQQLQQLLANEATIANQSWQQLKDIEAHLKAVVLAKKQAVAAVNYLQQGIKNKVTLNRYKNDHRLFTFSYAMDVQPLLQGELEKKQKSKRYSPISTIKKIAPIYAERDDLQALLAFIDALDISGYDLLLSYTIAAYQFDQQSSDKTVQIINRAESVLQSLADKKDSIKGQLLLSSLYFLQGDKEPFTRDLSHYHTLIPTSKEYGKAIKNLLYLTARHSQCGIALQIYQSNKEAWISSKEVVTLTNLVATHCKNQLAAFNIEQLINASQKYITQGDKYARNDITSTLQQIGDEQTALTMANDTENLFLRATLESDAASILLDKGKRKRAKKLLKQAETSYSAALKEKARRDEERRKQKKHVSTLQNSHHANAAKSIAISHASMGSRSTSYLWIQKIKSKFTLEDAITQIGKHYVSSQQTDALDELFRYLPEASPSPNSYSERESSIFDIASAMLTKKKYDLALHTIAKTESAYHIGYFLMNLINQYPEYANTTHTVIANYIGQLTPVRSLWVFPESQALKTAANQCVDLSRALEKTSSDKQFNEASQQCIQYSDIARYENNNNHQLLARTKLLEFSTLAGVAQSYVSRRYIDMDTTLQALKAFSFTDAWINEQLFLSLLRLKPLASVTTIHQLIGQLYTLSIDKNLKKDKSWALLISLVNDNSFRFSSAKLDQPALLKAYQTAKHIIAKESDQTLKAKISIEILLSEAQILEKGEPITALDNLLAAHTIATGHHTEKLSFIQLLTANLFRDHPKVVAQQRLASIVEIIKTSPENEFLDRLIKHTSYLVLDNCSQVSALFDKEVTIAQGKLPAVGGVLMLHALQNQSARLAQEIQRLHCLSPKQLSVADSDQQLVEVLLRIAPKETRTQQVIYQKITDIEERLHSLQ